MSIIKASELDPNERYYKLTNEEECHNKMQYKTGLNTDILPFDPSEACKAGGLYFFSESQLITYRNYIVFELCWIRQVTFVGIEDEPVYREYGKYQTHQFVLGERQLVKTLEDIMKYVRIYDVCVAKKTVMNDGDSLRHIPDKYITFELCLAAVTNTGWILRYIPEKYITYEMCLTAVTNDGCALDCVPIKHKTPVLCSIAVAQNGCAIRYVPHEHKTFELCLAAVTNDKDALLYMPSNMYEQIKKAIMDAKIESL